MSYEQAKNITGVVYLLFLIYIIVSMKKYKNSPIIILLLVTIITPYNLLISKIANYQETTYFTFLYRTKISIFSLIDIYFFGIILIYFRKLLKIKTTKIIKIFLIRDIVYIIIGTVALILSKGYMIDNGRTYLGNMRGIIYIWGGYFLFSYFLYKNRDFKLQEVLNILIKLIIGSTLLSSLYKTGEIWTRFGRKVTILSQEWATFFIIFIIVYFYFYNKFYQKNIKNKFYLVLMILIAYLNMYKGNLIYLVVFFIYISIFCTNFQITNFIKIYVLGLLSIAIILFFIVKFSDNIAINTRKLQYNQYIDYIEKREYTTLSYLIGGGIGSAYEGKMGDFGESYEIDRQKYGEYKFSLQTPILSNFKDVGILGVTFTLITNLYILKTILQKNKRVIFIKKSNNKKYKFLMIGYFLTYNLVTLVVVMGVPSLSLFLGYLYAEYNKLLGEKI